jgi:membrane-associated protease RseP (regulator of RpoE activity)
MKGTVMRQKTLSMRESSKIGSPLRGQRSPDPMEERRTFMSLRSTLSMIVATLVLFVLTGGTAHAEYLPRLGVDVISVDMREMSGSPLFAKGYRGLYVRFVQPGSPAQLAGLKVGDYLTGAHTIRTNNPGDLKRAINLTPGNSQMLISIYRLPDFTHQVVAAVLP